MRLRKIEYCSLLLFSLVCDSKMIAPYNFLLHFYAPLNYDNLDIERFKIRQNKNKGE